MGSWRLDDDDALLTELRDALRAADSVPAEFLTAARGAWAWRNVDEELAVAQLAFDSACDVEPAGLTRSGSGSRTLTFSSGDVLVEIEVTSTGVIGQLSPASGGRVTARTSRGTFDESTIDPAGYFTLRVPPSEPVRLDAHTSGYHVATSWVCLT